MPCGFRIRLGPFSAFRASIFLWRGRSAHNRGAKRSEPLLCAAGRLVCFGVWCSKGAASWDKLVGGGFSRQVKLPLGLLRLPVVQKLTLPQCINGRLLFSRRF